MTGKPGSCLRDELITHPGVVPHYDRRSQNNPDANYLEDGQNDNICPLFWQTYRIKGVILHAPIVLPGT